MNDPIMSILSEAAERAILPRFQKLASAEIIEKAPGELVTAADREAEAIITEALLRLTPGAIVIGEEACAENPDLVNRIGERDVWLLDPLDGTANFAAGRRPFAIMLARLEQGRCLASWMFDPVSGRLCRAAVGEGAWIDGRRIEAPPVPSGGRRGALISHVMSPDQQARIRSRLSAIENLPKLLCAGEEYPAIATGERQLSIFWRTLPWDHLPGALFLTEAGGYVSRLDGSPYVETDLDRTGLIVAQSEDLAREILSLLSD